MLGGVPPSARVNREEIFGPVAPIVPFNTDDEGIALANDTEFGLVAYAFTESLRRAVTVAEQLETGMVGINQGIVSNLAAPSAASRRPDWVGKAVPRASRSIWKPSTSASACESSARETVNR